MRLNFFVPKEPKVYPQEILDLGTSYTEKRGGPKVRNGEPYQGPQQSGEDLVVMK